MNWYKAKTILIFFFLSTNIFLLVNILNATNKATVISDEVVSSAVEIMAQNGISIDPGIIPRRNKAVTAVTAENIIQDYTSFAEKILGGPVQKNTDGKYAGPAGQLMLKGDTFAFTAVENRAQKNTAPIKAASSFLKELGFDLSHTQRTVNGSTVEYRKSFAGLPFLNGYITLKVENGAVVSADGCWFQEQKRSLFSEKNTLKNITSILVDYAAQGGSASAVTDLEFGYALPKSSAYHKNAELVPTWVITTDQGDRIFMDARENNT